MSRDKQTTETRFRVAPAAMLGVLMGCLGFGAGTAAQSASDWQCTLDLHQGDQGSLEFRRTGTAIQGRTVVHRGSNRFEHTIAGNWSGELIKFNRKLSATSQQPFRGVALRADDGKVRMGGRFAYRYAGVWSGDCEERARPAPPKTHSTGQLEIRQTWTADLDAGKVGEGREADIWFQAVTATERYVTPRNGAKIKVVGNRSVGRDGCAAARLTAAKVPMSQVPSGTYVCVLTNQGRYSQFRVNASVGPSPGVLRIGYTTWEKTP